MPKSLFFKILFLITAMALIISGCSINFGGSSATSGALDGGVYKTNDQGTSWAQKVWILTVGVRKNIAPFDIATLAMDPQDNKAIYAGSIENGLFYSYDGGDGWQTAAGLGKMTITNLAVDPLNKCVIYATAANKLYKSSDCSRAWSVVYFDPELKVSLTALAIDYVNSHNVFIGTSRGEIIKSSDQGASWQTLNRFKTEVKKIVINPADIENMFVMASNAVFRSADAGLNWISLEDKLKSVAGNKNIRDLIMVKADQPTVFLATNYGLLESNDLGEAWSKINLITLKTSAAINGIMVNPNNAKEIYYVTNTTFFRSLDGGQNWTTKKLPTSRSGSKLLIDPKNPGIIYLTTRQLKK